MLRLADDKQSLRVGLSLALYNTISTVFSKVSARGVISKGQRGTFRFFLEIHSKKVKILVLSLLRY